MPPRPRARCVRCGHVAPLRAFEVEVALSADDAGDNDWVIVFSCPRCEAADRPAALPESQAVPAAPEGAATGTAGSGPRANPMYDPRMP